MKIFTFLLLLISFSFKGYSQNTDSVNKVYASADKYISLAYSYPLHSPEHQLYLDSALLFLPNQAQLWQQKVMPYFKSRQYELGMKYLNKAIAYDSSYQNYKGFITCIFIKSYKDAIDIFKDLNLRSTRPRYIMDYSYNFYIAISYLQLNELESTSKYLTADLNENKLSWGVNAKPSYLNLFYSGIVNYERLENQNAINYFDETLKIYPEFAEALYYKGLCLCNQQKFKEGIELLEMAKTNLMNGYTFSEVNADYELYPFQIDTSIVSSSIVLAKLKFNNQ